MKSAVIVFPGSNRDRDMQYALTRITGDAPQMIWHAEPTLPPLDLIVLPGGFSYGDYLRTGAIAARSPVMRAVADAAAKGVPVLGVCNGFQILCEAGLLPGILMRNASLRFICRDVHLRVETADSPFTRAYAKGDVFRTPVAHGEGNYTADAETLARLNGEDRVAFRYVTAAGEATAEANANGSVENIAGILSDRRNVLGLMPHPENMIEPAHGNTGGRRLFESLTHTLVAA
ncbi:MAG: phosphoribosylformylglycinamidine synthase subunit PurQ [Bauldia sp.]|nr:phosphoribosylformylglycinamidine synthase subunit PurQ [Bauldia sp.]